MTRRRTNNGPVKKPVVRAPITLGDTLAGGSVLATPVFDRCVRDLGDPFVAGAVKVVSES